MTDEEREHQEYLETEVGGETHGTGIIAAVAFGMGIAFGLAYAGITVAVLT